MLADLRDSVKVLDAYSDMIEELVAEDFDEPGFGLNDSLNQS